MKKYLHTIHARSFAVFIAVLAAILVCASNCAQAELVKPGQKSASATITPKNDFIVWAAQMAPSDTKVLLAVDGTQWPRTEVNIARISDLYKNLPFVKDAVNEICPEFSTLTVDDLAWLTEQVAFYSRDTEKTPGAKNTTADIVSIRINDKEQAERFLADHYTKIMQRAEAHRLETLAAAEADDEEAASAVSIDPQTVEILTAEINGRTMRYLKDSLAWYVSDDCAYLSTNEKYLKSFLQRRSPQDSLSQNQNFIKAMKQLTFKKGFVAYVDLTASDEQLQFFNDLVNDLSEQDVSKDNELYRYFKAMRNAIYGAEFRQGQLICEGFINADVANSGALGKVCFNPKYNLDYPAWDKRTDKSLICLGGNLRYVYDGIYELLGIPDKTREIRDLPANLCTSEGIDLRNDILEGLLSGQLVVSIEDIDFQALGKALQMPEENDRQKKTEDAIAEASQDDPQYSTGTDEITVKQQNRRRASRVGKKIVNSIAKGQWNISIGLSSQQALQKLSQKNESLGRMLNDKEFIVVRDSDMWISSPSQPSGNRPALSSLPCWQQLQKISKGPAVAQWMFNVRDICKGLESGLQGELASDPTLRFILSKLQDCGWYCGRMSITPQGLHLCEVIEYK